MSTLKFTRRQALESVGSLIAGSSLAQGQGTKGESPVRLAPVNELVSVLEFEEQAKLKLSKTAFAAIAGSDREAFELITFRPRNFIDTTTMDLSTELFGDKLFMPILVGATPQQKRFHPEGELATARGAAAAKTLVVVSSHSGVPIGEIAAQAKTPLWYQVDAADELAAVRTQMQQAVKAGCKAICIAVARWVGTTAPPLDWAVIDQLRKGISVPVLVKGIMTPADAKAAVQKGVQGIVVSTNSTASPNVRPAAIEVLPAIADAVGGKTVVLYDGSVRRGSDALKALALGAKAVLVGRPAMWGLAPYGAEGVKTVFELLRDDLTRAMSGLGAPKLSSIDRNLVKIHPRRTTNATSAGQGSRA